MPQNDINKSGSRTKIIITILITGVVMIAGLLYWHYGDDENNDETPSAMPSIASNMHVEEIGTQEVASMAAVSGKTVSGTVTRRPDYVSESEWQAFQNLTRQNPDINLTNLVNKLLFIKKKQAWLSSGENTGQRRQLARQLLDMIPDQLDIEAIDSETAKEMEGKLNADLR
jgi:hypothetical protein